MTTTFRILTPTSGTWLVCEAPDVHGRQAHPCTAVHQYANDLLRCEVHKGLYCGHVGLVLDYMKEHPEEGDTGYVGTAWSIASNTR